MLVNCLLNAFAICVGDKVMVLFLCCVGFLLANPCIDFQRVCVCLGVPSICQICVFV